MGRTKGGRVSKPDITKQTLLGEIALLVAGISDPDQLLCEIVNRLKVALNAEDCAVAMLGSGGTFYCEGSVQDASQDRLVWNDTPVPVTHGDIGEVLQTGKPRLSTGAADHENPAQAQSPVTVMVLPLKIHAEIVGACTFRNSHGDGFAAQYRWEL